MKKKNVINLVKYYSEKNDIGFRNEANEIARSFDEDGDYQLAEYIMSLLSNVSTFVPQVFEKQSDFFEEIDEQEKLLLLPDPITHDLLGIVNAVERHIGINKFLFQGKPGTGKTEAVKQLAKILNRKVYAINFSSIVDSKLGQTQKNISKMFDEIDGFSHPDKVLLLFDEIDAIALDRINENDHREMGRTVSSLLKNLDKVNESVVIVATTNLYNRLDKALVRRFDSIIDFDRYSDDDLMDIAEAILDGYLVRLKLGNRDIRLFRKIMSMSKERLNPGELKNVIKTSVGFSDIEDDSDYLRRLYYMICGEKPYDLKKLNNQGFTVREIGILTNKSKSSVSRLLKEGV